jgi:hypothetical protein
MKLDDLKLQCYAEKDAEGDWFALCLNLNISATASSYKEVANKLELMIKEYISEAITEDKEYISDLIPRRAPLNFYIKYYCYLIMDYLNNHKSSKKHKVYNTVLPVHV